MKLFPTFLVLLVAAEHFYIAWLEMTQIPSEKAAEMFKLPYEFMEQKRVQTPAARDLPQSSYSRLNVSGRNYAAGAVD